MGKSRWWRSQVHKCRGEGLFCSIEGKLTFVCVCVFFTVYYNSIITLIMLQRVFPVKHLKMVNLIRTLLILLLFKCQCLFFPTEWKVSYSSFQQHSSDSHFPRGRSRWHSHSIHHQRKPRHLQQQRVKSGRRLKVWLAFSTYPPTFVL